MGYDCCRTKPCFILCQLTLKVFSMSTFHSVESSLNTPCWATSYLITAFLHQAWTVYRFTQPKLLRTIFVIGQLQRNGFRTFSPRSNYRLLSLTWRKRHC